ncbi:hypothetical protein BHU72_09445 [Desulfuribacillus stibiiarsenatis]|uniref:Colicin V production protein n=1 Tax=Desulfuribacillus stibiiarsenatis TaxID=1390249 RepID=A0A1E5L2S8_9FIRM|nr:CvpA family protein [Desulfuribacillus stibiiarsenatis]OEH84432.1 hypothetical protein BHU72_09445 [Desulfuribacillus stibiiarsenatis]
MSVLDGIILLLIVVSLIRGYSRGFVLQFISLISVIASFIIAYKYHPEVAAIIAPYFQLKEIDELLALPIPINLSINNTIASAAAFALLFFAIRIALLLVGRTLDMFTKLPLINSVNRILGLLLSFAETMIILIIIINIASFLPIVTIQNGLAQSQIGQYLLTDFGFVRDKIIRVLQDSIA